MEVRKNSETVKGHCGTYFIYENESGLFVAAVGTVKKEYSTREAARRALRIMEQRYLQANPNAEVKNRDVWADHGVLWVEDMDGNYYTGRND